MFLLAPHYQIESRYSNYVPFSEEFSGQLIDKRDQNPSILNRLVTQVGLSLTPFLSLIDLVAQVPFALLSVCFSLPKEQLLDRIKQTTTILICTSIGYPILLIMNLFSKKVGPSDKPGFSLPLCARSFAHLCHYRDSAPTFFRKSLSQLGFGALMLASLIDIFVQTPFVLIQKVFFLSAQKNVYRINQALLTSALSAYAFSKNFFCPKIVPAISTWDRFFSEDFIRLQGGAINLLRSLMKYQSISITKKFLSQIYKKTISSEQVSDFLRISIDGLEHKPQTGIETLEFFYKEKQIKAAGHWLSLDGKVNQIDLEGIMRHEHWIVSTVLDSLFRLGASEKFEALTLKREGLNQLQSALKQLAMSSSHLDLAKQINKGELTFIDSGWYKHYVYLVFFGPYLAIANRQNRSDKSLDNIEVFKIDPKKVSAQTLESIAIHQHLRDKRSEKFLYKTLPSLLSPINKPLKDAFCKEFKEICPKNQKVGNCGLTSLKAAVRFAWTALLCGDLNTLDPKTIDSDVFDQAKLESKFFTDWAASTLFPLDETSQARFQGLFGEQAISQAEKKTQRAKENLSLLQERKVLAQSLLV